jgi:arylsulfatase
MWDSLTQEQRNYSSQILAVRAAMIEDMDSNVGRLIDHLKQTGEYDNTLIVFTSDNSASEAAQLPASILIFNGINYTALPEYVKNLNNSLSNLGDMTSNVNYGAWGPYVSSVPLSGFKASLYEGGTRSLFIIKEPTVTNNTPKEKIVKVLSIHIHHSRLRHNLLAQLQLPVAFLWIWMPQ